METTPKDRKRGAGTESERRPTLSDVARIAQVSTATASRALSNPGLVSAKTRTAVMDAAERADYRPNLMARSLRTQQAHAIIVLVPALDNPFYPEIIKGMESAAHARGYSLTLGITSHDSARENSYIELVRTQRADGLMILDGGLTHLLGGAAGFAVPTVQVIERITGVDLPYVKIDDIAAASRATRHLIDLGHTRIGHIAGLARYSVTPDRIAGYRLALEAAGISFDPTLVEPGDFSISGGEAAAQILMRNKRPPTALFCGNDDSAIGAMRHLRELGLKVPGDVSVVGFDDTQLAAASEPPLTTLRQPRFEIGATAMTMLLDILARIPDCETARVMPVDMILRDSTAPLKRLGR